MDIAITGYQMVVGLGVIGSTLAALIIGLKYYFNQKLKTQSNPSWRSRTKYAAYDVFRHSGIFFRAGLICAMVSSLLAFNYTQYNYVHETVEFIPDEIFEPITPPIVYPERKPIPPPPVSVKTSLIIEAVEEIAQPEFVETVVKVDADIDPNAVPAKDDVLRSPPIAPTPPPIPDLPEEDDGPLLIAEFLPRMCSSCDTKDISRNEKNECASKEMMSFVLSQLRYPTLAREHGVEGMCPVRFVVRKDGTISDIELLRDIGAGCGKEALRVTSMLKDQCWSPGIQNGRRVSVQMVLPIRFKLQ